MRGPRRHRLARRRPPPQRVEFGTGRGDRGGARLPRRSQGPRRNPARPGRLEGLVGGHDIRELPRLGRELLGWSDSLRVLIRAVQENPCPVIARIEGSVWGGACELAMACDLAIATPEVTFAITPARLGIPYNLTGP
ncbi:MAG: enoyl-CoA hydratase-related protein [Isosphaeraceae bacterium]